MMIKKMTLVLGGIFLIQPMNTVLLAQSNNENTIQQSEYYGRWTGKLSPDIDINELIIAKDAYYEHLYEELDGQMKKTGYKDYIFWKKEWLPRLSGSSLLESLKEEYAYIDQLNQSFLDGGIKPEIMDVLLDDFAASSEVYAKLLEGSPYLSDDVLIAAITRNIPLNQWDLAMVLLLNARLSPRVMSVFNQTQPLTPFLASIVHNADGASMRYVLELGIEAKNKELANLERTYIHAALFDSSITRPYGQIAELYESSAHIHELETKVSALLKQKDYGEAQIVLNDYLAAYPDSNLVLMQMQIDMAKAGLHYLQLNEQQVYSLEQIAASTTSWESTKAKTLLGLIHNYPLPSFEMPVVYTPELRLAQQQAYAPLPRDLMSLSPNPSDGLLYVAYELPKEFTQAFLFMYNSIGQQIASWDISKYPMLYKIDCEDYPTGIYSVSLVVDGEKIETQKLTLITE